MSTVQQTHSGKTMTRPLVEAIVAYVVFCGLSFLSRFAEAVFLLVLLFGLAFPLIWAALTRTWGAMGFTRRNLGPALLWGAGTGIAAGAYTIVVFFSESRSFPPPMLGLQLAVGIPVWLLIMSPFQEFFFRGWLQPRCQAVAGKWGGLLITALCFTLWHFFPPFESSTTTSLPLSSVSGIVTMVGFGLIWGYIFQRTENIVAPWLSHVLAGIATVVIGLNTYVQFTP